MPFVLHSAILIRATRGFWVDFFYVRYRSARFVVHRGKSFLLAEKGSPVVFIYCGFAVTGPSCLDGQRRDFRVKMLSNFWAVGLVFRASGMKFDGGQGRAIRFA